LIVHILEMVRDQYTQAQIAKILGITKPHVYYYVKKAIIFGYVKEVCRNRIKILEVTQIGKNFLDQYSYGYGKQYSKQSSGMHYYDQLPICRAENVRFKAYVYRLPTKSLDWNKVEMNNWSQYNNIVDDIKVHLNNGRAPTIEFIPSPIDGSNPWELFGILYNDCNQVAKKLEMILDMEIGRLELEPGAEWVVYDPLAKLISRYNGQITLDGLGKINASKPLRRGEIEYFDPRFAVDYITMPKRVSNIEKLLEDLLKERIAAAEQAKNKDGNSNEEVS
jgi:hypothetical protein